MQPVRFDRGNERRTDYKLIVADTTENVHTTEPHPHPDKLRPSATIQKP